MHSTHASIYSLMRKFLLAIVIHLLPRRIQRVCVFMHGEVHGWFALHMANKLRYLPPLPPKSNPTKATTRRARKKKTFDRDFDFIFDLALNANHFECCGLFYCFCIFVIEMVKEMKKRILFFFWHAI